MKIWSTPQAIFDKLNEEFRFTVDLCADPENAKVVPFYRPSLGLLDSTPWHGRGFLNPPYGKEIRAWLRKAFYEVQNKTAKVVVAIVPARTNAPWWHDYVMRADEIRFIRKKLAFVQNNGQRKGVPFTGHAIIVFGRKRGKPKVSSWEQPKSFRAPQIN